MRYFNVMQCCVKATFVAAVAFLSYAKFDKSEK